MEGATTTISTLFSKISEVITSLLGSFSTIASELMNNVFFQITMGIVVLGLGISFTFYMVKKLKRKGR